MGFRATDDDADADEAAQVVDGTATTAELTPQQHGELFVDLCTKLRALGATEVRAERYRAVFGGAVTAPVASAGPVVTRVPIGAPKPKQPEEKLELYEGERLTEEEKAARREKRRIAELLVQS